MKPKEWLYANGHISKIGRGRMSAEHIALVKEAVANGVKIEGYETVKSSKPSVSTEKPTAPAVERTKIDPNRVIDCPDPLRDEREFDAFVTVDGKTSKIGKRTVCNGCGNSLSWCWCPTPSVWVDHTREAVVTFKFTKGDG